MEQRCGEGLLLQLLEAIFTWRRMSNLTTAPWKHWSCQYQWSNSTEGQTSNLPSFSRTILIIVFLLSMFPSVGLWFTQQKKMSTIASLPASSNYSSLAPSTQPYPVSHTSNLGTHWIPWSMSIFIWVYFHFSSFHYVQYTPSEGQIRLSITLITFN